jgi:hypothetical protein
VSELREIALDKSNVQRVDLDVQLNVTSCFDCQQSLLWLK